MTVLPLFRLGGGEGSGRSDLAFLVGILWCVITLYFYGLIDDDDDDSWNFV